MNRIAELGDRVLAAQTQLGLAGPNYYRPGLTEEELWRFVPSFKELPSSELHDLYVWHDGVADTQAAMGTLWIRPGFYFISLEQAVRDNNYGRNRLDDWLGTWYPILTNGAGARRFCDIQRVSGGYMPVFYYEPDSAPVTGQIYDSIEGMFACMLQCYENGIYCVGSDGFLYTDFRREAEICRRANPKSDYWRQPDLF